MKKLLTVIILLISIISNSQKINSIDIVNIPDDAFRKHLISSPINTNGDDYIQISEANNAEWINVNNKGISDLTGIELFINITELYVANNSLTHLDLSKNIKLQDLWCNDNELISIKIPHSIITIDCSHNRLNKLNLNSCNKLRIILCDYNLLTRLNFSSLKNVEEVSCSNNKLTYLNIKNGYSESIFNMHFNPRNNIFLKEIVVDNTIIADRDWYYMKDKYVKYVE